MARLSVDVGNTSIGLGAWSGGEPRLERETTPEGAARRLAELAGGSSDVPVAVISVAPARLERLIATLGPGLGSRLHLLRTPPAGLGEASLLESAGADRIANALAARPGPAVIVDGGTAVTVDVLDASERFLGGYIAAGPEAAAAGLAGATAQLPLVRGALVCGAWARGAPPPSLAPAAATQAALSAGLWGAAVGGVDRLVEEAVAFLRRASPEPPAVRLIATGGWGEAWAAASRHRGIEVDALHVHRGIAVWAGWA